MAIEEPLSDEQRDRALNYLRNAYAEGRIDEDGFEDRMSQALTATTRRDLNASLRGLAGSVPVARQPMVPRHVADRANNVGAGLTHLSGLLPPFFVGPAIMKAIATPGSRLQWEAGRAMSFQMSALFAGIVITVLVATGLIPQVVWMMSALVWFLATVTFSARAFNGQDSTGALGDVLPFKTPEQNQRSIEGPRR